MVNSGISILIVEDDPRISSLLIEVLSPKFRCATAGSASDAIRLMDSHFFRVAVVDIGLPGMSGLSLCRLIVNRSPRTVVIVVSGNTDEQSLAEAMKAGAFDYITKPFELSQVLASVERALERNSPGAVA
jgi:DNA-binding response OmpR family regulator